MDAVAKSERDAPARRPVIYLIGALMAGAAGAIFAMVFPVTTNLTGAFLGKAFAVALFVMAIILVFALSLRLRQGEIETIFKIGCSRMTIAKLLAAEILIILMTSATLCAIMLAFVGTFTNDLVRMLFIG